MKPRLLDLFCGAGGCTKGYQRAGFYVVGADTEPQPNYCGDDFIRGDALRLLEKLLLGERMGMRPWRLSDFDAIHASPPCQRYTTMGQRFAATQVNHPDLIAETRWWLREIGLPYVIENVPGARRELEGPIWVCGRGLGQGVSRHRLFECSFSALSIQCACDGSELPVYGKLDGRRLWTRRDGSELRAAKTLKEAQRAMGIAWMAWDELREAIPPAYTEHIGHFLMAAVRERELAA